jgi:hypothetical protein
VWAEAHHHADRHATGIRALFRGSLRRTTLIVISVCALGLTAHWALMFWHSAHLRTLARDAGWTKQAIDVLANHALYLLTIGAIIGNFAAGAAAKFIGYRRAIGAAFAAYFGLMMLAYGVVRDANGVLFWLPFIGAAQGAFALFTMFRLAHAWFLVWPKQPARVRSFAGAQLVLLSVTIDVVRLAARLAWA